MHTHLVALLAFCRQGCPIGSMQDECGCHRGVQPLLCARAPETPWQFCSCYSDSAVSETARFFLTVSGLGGSQPRLHETIRIAHQHMLSWLVAKCSLTHWGRKNTTTKQRGKKKQPLNKEQREALFFLSFFVLRSTVLAAVKNNIASILSVRGFVDEIWLHPCKVPALMTESGPTLLQKQPGPCRALVVRWSPFSAASKISRNRSQSKVNAAWQGEQVPRIKNNWERKSMYSQPWAAKLPTKWTAHAI